MNRVILFFLVSLFKFLFTKKLYEIVTILCFNISSNFCFHLLKKTSNPEWDLKVSNFNKILISLKIGKIIWVFLYVLKKLFWCFILLTFYSKISIFIKSFWLNVLNIFFICFFYKNNLYKTSNDHYVLAKSICWKQKFNKFYKKLYNQFQLFGNEYKKINNKNILRLRTKNSLRLNFSFLIKTSFIDIWSILIVQKHRVIFRRCYQQITVHCIYKKCGKKTIFLYFLLFFLHLLNIWLIIAL